MGRECWYNISNQQFLSSNRNPPSFLQQLPIIFGIELRQDLFIISEGGFPLQRFLRPGPPPLRPSPDTSSGISYATVKRIAGTSRKGSTRGRLSPFEQFQASSAAFSPVKRSNGLKAGSFGQMLSNSAAVCWPYTGTIPATFSSDGMPRKPARRPGRGRRRRWG